MFPWLRPTIGRQVRARVKQSHPIPTSCRSIFSDLQRWQKSQRIYPAAQGSVPILEVANRDDSWLKRMCLVLSESYRGTSRSVKVQVSSASRKRTDCNRAPSATAYW